MLEYDAVTGSSYAYRYVSNRLLCLFIIDCMISVSFTESNN